MALRTDIVVHDDGAMCKLYGALVGTVKAEGRRQLIASFQACSGALEAFSKSGGADAEGKELCKAAHKVKGQAKMLFLSQLAFHAEELETFAGDDSDGASGEPQPPEVCVRIFSVLQEAFDAALPCISSWVDSAG